MFDLVKFSKKLFKKKMFNFQVGILKILGKFYKDVTCKDIHRISYKKSSASHENLGHDEFVICF